jgi:hypothetical protein
MLCAMPEGPLLMVCVMEYLPSWLCSALALHSDFDYISLSFRFRFAFVSPSLSFRLLCAFDALDQPGC